MPTPAPPTAPPRPFGAVLTALVTPFDDEGRVDLATTAHLAETLVAGGHDGLVVGGTTGESPTTSSDEKLDVLRAVLAAVGDRCRVVAGIGTYDTAGTVRAARAARDAGAHGALVVSPYYSRPTQQGLLAHVLAVADGCDLDLMLYDIPVRTGVAFETETLLRLAEHPRVVAVKDAKDDLHAAATVMAGSDLAWYSGTDELHLAHLTQGAAGVVSVIGHVVGPQLRAMVAAVDAADLATANAVRRRLIGVCDAVMRRAPGVVAVKAALELVGTIPNRSVRLPHLPADTALVAAVAAALEEADVL